MKVKNRKLEVTMERASKVITIENFHSEILENSRKLFIYLPPGYESNSYQKYPVLYMHAGQRLFEPVIKNDESWNVHKTTDMLIYEGKIQEIIIVGIAHKRIIENNEFCHFISPDKHIECSGLLYEKFIINEVKPYIDEHFRTLTNAENTALIGSSAGGLSTYNIGFRNPEVFGKIGMLSPFFVKVEDDHSELKLYEMYEGKKDLKIWMDIGSAEGFFLVKHVRDIAETLLKNGYKYREDLIFYQDPNGAHFEKDWGERMHLPLIYFFGDVGNIVNVTLDGRDVVGLTGMKVKINPIVTYDSGFEMSVLDGVFVVDNPDVLEVMGDGTIIPKKIGEAEVTFVTQGVKGIPKKYKVIETLSEFVDVSVTVEVPENTPVGERIYMSVGMILDRIEKNRFAGNFKVPRDLACRFKFSRGFRLFEVDKLGKPIPNRKFKATKDLQLNYTVENWIGL